MWGKYLGDEFSQKKPYRLKNKTICPKYSFFNSNNQKLLSGDI